jgi:SAM-dependent methyltransferase
MAGMHGRESSFALGWRNWEDQEVRFKALSGIADMSNCSVLDAGCGYGDLLPYLSLKYSDIHYTGIDQIDDFLAEAMRRYGNLPQNSFLKGDFMTMNLPTADFVLASGSLNYRSSDPDFIFKAITKLYRACHRGLTFNLLKHMMPDGLLVAYDPAKILRYCRTHSARVELLCGYAKEDFTIYMHRDISP